MKLSKYILSLAVLMVITLSCKTDFSINGEYQERAIVHAIIDQNDTIHLIKVNKTFLGDGNALDYAQIQDSSLFGSVKGKLYNRVTNQLIAELRDTILTFDEEDLVPGSFYNQDKKMYYFKTKTSDFFNTDGSEKDVKLRMELDIDNGKHKVTGTTDLVRGVKITRPNANNQLALAENTIVDDGDYKTYNIEFRKGTNAVLYDLRIRFKYKEFYLDGADSQDKFVEINMGETNIVDISGGDGAKALNGKQFYQILKDRVAVNPNIEKRVFKGFDFQITGASEDLESYILVNQPSSSLAQSQPTFSNLEGGIGIFASRMKSVLVRGASSPLAQNIRSLNSNSTKELCTGQITGLLNFCSDHDLDNSTSFKCN